MNTITPIIAFAALFAVAGCSQEAPENPRNDAAQTAPAQTAAPSLPDGFFLAEAPAGAVPVSEARSHAKAGDDVALTGYIGGRKDPFTEGLALFLIADAAKAPACGDDHCPTPWDACCVPGEVIAANSATVQVAGENGRALRLSLQGQKGLEPGVEITVVGKVREANEGMMLVDAAGINVANAAP